MVSSSRVSEAVEGVGTAAGRALGSDGNASELRTYDMFRGGRCFQGELRVVLAVVSDVLATEAAADKTVENFVTSPPYFKGRR